MTDTKAKMPNQITIAHIAPMLAASANANGGNGMLSSAPMSQQPNVAPSPSVGPNLIASLAQIIATHPDEAQKQQLLAALFSPDTFRNETSDINSESFARYYPSLAGYAVDGNKIVSTSGDTEEQALGRRTGLTPPDIFGTGRTPLNDADMYRMGAYITKPDSGGGKPQKAKQ